MTGNNRKAINIGELGLPILEVIDELCAKFCNNQNIVLEAAPGAGKTSIVPLYLLKEIASTQKILLLEPRRLAARNAAVRLAELLGEPVGNTVGFRIRNETLVSDSTRIEVITEGILVRMLQSDPELADVGLIIFDEFHERSLESDLGLAFSLEVQQTLRDDLKLLVMSATLEIDSIASLLNNAPQIKSEGRSFPVDIDYMPPRKNSDWSSVLIPAVQKILEINSHESQDILVFLPGIAEIKFAQKLLLPLSEKDPKIEIMLLYGDLPFSQQKQVFSPVTNKIKIILSTNIAETSVTINGVGAVIDSGLMRQSAFDPNVGFNRLRTNKISKASATQRCGRAGRLGPGFCIRLWSESESLREQNLPDILRHDLTPFALELANWGIVDSKELKLLDQPSDGILKQARRLLEDLEAVNKQLIITSHGKKINSLGVHPRIAHMILESVPLGLAELACLIAVMLEEKDVFFGERRNNSDFMSRLTFILAAQNNNHTYKHIFTQSKNLFVKLKNQTNLANYKQYSLAHSVDRAAELLARAFPDRIAQKRGNGYRLSNGSGAISDEQIIEDNQFIVAIKLGGHSQTAKIFQSIILNREDLEALFQLKIIEQPQIRWDDASESVRASVERRYGALCLSTTVMNNPNRELVVQGLIQGIRKKGLPWTPPLRQLQARVEMLRQQTNMSNQFSDFSDENLDRTLEHWLSPFIQGLTKLNQISSQKLAEGLQSQLDWNSQQLLNQLMPVEIEVASGSKVKLDYCQGDKPVLAVKLQEMFGEKKTPKVAGGLLPVVIHLLSPARRPLAITEDLQSFWANGYLDVKKEMKGGYPKHPWPGNPLPAIATRFTKARM